MKKTYFKGLLLLGTAALSANSAIYAEPSLKDAKDAARTAIYDITDKSSIDIKFDKGTAALSSSQKGQIKSLVSAFASDGRVKDVVVAAYADENYPRERSELTKGARELATRRGDAVRDELKRAGAKEVTVYNMAEKANWFEKTFVTSDAQVKREASSSPDAVSEEDAFFESLGRHLRKVGGASKVIVVMRHKSSAEAH
jgi:hypothetical protein